MLLADWFTKLANQSGLNLSQHGSSGDGFTLGAPNDFHVIAKFIQESPFLRFVASDPDRQTAVEAIGHEAVARVQRGELGGIVWYSTGLHEDEFKLSSSFMGSFLQRLGSQTRVVGWRRLGSNILLEFTERLPADWNEKNALLAPKSVVHVHIAAPGPCAGRFSSHLAHNVVETVAAICTFALGRGVTLPPSLFPSKPEALQQLDARQTDGEILTLARKHVALDIFSGVALPGGIELFTRIRGALLAFDAAIRQERDSVACILYVVAAEALTTPYTPWRHSKLTKRFIEFFDDLMPDDLDQIVAHGNFEEVFGIRRGERSARALRKELLDHIYDYRSGQLHQGFHPSYKGLGAVFDMKEEVRRGLFADFAEAAILRYLASPRASVIGHPNFA